MNMYRSEREREKKEREKGKEFSREGGPKTCHFEGIWDHAENDASESDGGGG